MFLSIGRLSALGAACNTVSSSTYADSTKKNWITVKPKVDSPYYDSTCGCFKEGYKPEPQYTLNGLFGIAPSVEAGDAWKVCKPPVATSTCPACKSCPTCPTCPKCAVCAAATPCPTCPQCPTCATESALSKPPSSPYGPTLGLLIAAIVIGGGGYYAYKKGVFGGKKK